MLRQETIDLGIDVFGTKEAFEEWLNTKTIVMPLKPINYTNDEVYTELQRIAWGVY